MPTKSLVLFFPIFVVALALTECVVSGADAVVMRTVLVEDENENPKLTAKTASEALLKKMGSVPLKLVLVLDSYEGADNKDALLQGLYEALPKEKIFGLSTYGSFIETQAADGDTLALLGIGGDGIDVQVSLKTHLGVSSLKMDDAAQEIEAKLLEAGQKLAATSKRQSDHKLSIVLADAHSPKNGFFVRGLQKEYGEQAAILGGSANKNPNQNHIYYKGERLQDAAILLNLSGAFEVTLAGRFANQGDTVIKTSEEAASEALRKLGSKEPLGMLAFSCAGRKSKLDDIGDELATIKKVFPSKLIFGGFCAGEIGPADKTVETTNAECCGSGWYLMLGIFSEERVNR